MPFKHANESTDTFFFTSYYVVNLGNDKDRKSEKGLEK